MPWVGRKKVAFIPVFRPRASPPDQIPPDWGNLILSRVVYDPDPLLGGPDGSLRAWLRAASSGLADIDPVIFTMRTIDRQDVLPDALEPEMGESLREQGFDHAAIVMLGGLGAGSNRRFWSRFVMVESTGIWAMEIIHGIAGFRDLYHQDHMTDPAERDIHRFDEMSHSGLSHPTAFTKAGLGWLDQATVTRHSGPQTDYELQWIGLPQPPTSGRIAAVRIGENVPYMMVEARKKSDQFEAGVRSGSDGWRTPGIKTEGIIVYRVQTTDPNGADQNRKLPLYLLTKTALGPGQSAVVDDGIVVTNTGQTAGGYSVRIVKPTRTWDSWSSVAEGRATPGAPVSAVALANERFALFLADPAGGVYTTSTHVPPSEI